MRMCWMAVVGTQPWTVAWPFHRGVAAAQGRALGGYRQPDRLGHLPTATRATPRLADAAPSDPEGSLCPRRAVQTGLRIDAARHRRLSRAPRKRSVAERRSYEDQPLDQCCRRPAGDHDALSTAGGRW